MYSRPRLREWRHEIDLGTLFAVRLLGVFSPPDPSAGHHLGFAQACQAGARACLPRHNLSHEKCIATVRAVLAGQYLFDERIRLRALQLERLTPRQEEVLALMARGETNAGIAPDPPPGRRDGPQPRQPHPGQAGGRRPGRHRAVRRPAGFSEVAMAESWPLPV